MPVQESVEESIEESVEESIDEDVSEVVEVIEYSSLKVKELKSIAKEKGVAKYSSMKKQELIEALESIN